MRDICTKKPWLCLYVICILYRVFANEFRWKLVSTAFTNMVHSLRLVLFQEQNIIHHKQETSLRQQHTTLFPDFGDFNANKIKLLNQSWLVDIINFKLCIITFRNIFLKNTIMNVLCFEIGYA